MAGCSFTLPDDDGREVMIMRMLVRLAIWGLAAYGAKRLYDTYFGYADQAKKAGSAIMDRVGRASGRAKEETHDAVTEAATSRAHYARFRVIALALAPGSRFMVPNRATRARRRCRVPVGIRRRSRLPRPPGGLPRGGTGGARPSS